MINIVVPMAGKGSRFISEGYKDPKPLIPVRNKRMVEVVVNNLTPSYPHKFIFVCQNQHVSDYGLRGLLEKAAPGSKIIGIDGVTDGAACTVMKAKEYIDNNDQLMIANSDQWIDVNINNYLALMRDDSDLDGLIMTMTASDPKWSYVGFDGDIVTRVVEKEVISSEATVGIYNFRRGSDFVLGAEQMIRDDERSRGEFYVAPVYTRLFQKKAYKIGVFNIGAEADGMYGLGIPSDLKLFLDLDISKKALKF